MANALALPRRRPPDGGYARGEETRRRIVEAAMEVFADEGFAAASTRRIAAAAGVTPPALQYHFDSKEGLHSACADTIIADVSARLEPVLAAGRLTLAGGDPGEAVEALCDLMDVLTDLSLTSRETPVWRRFVARVQGDDSAPAQHDLKPALTAPIHALARALVACALGRPEEDEAVWLRTLLALSQLAGFHNDRGRALQALGWEDFDAGRLASLKAVVRENTRAALLAARGSDAAAS